MLIIASSPNNTREIFYPQNNTIITLFLYLWHIKHHRHFYESINGGEPTCIDDDIPFEIPDSWEWCRLAALSYVVSGTSYNKTDVDNEGIRILRGDNIQDGELRLHSSDVYLPLQYKDEDKNIAKGDIILVGSTGSELVIGKAAFISKVLENTQIGAFLRIVRPYCKEYAQYVAVIFKTTFYREYIRKKASGTNINNIKSGHLENFLIPVPPVTEQHRIVNSIAEKEQHFLVIQSSRIRYKHILSGTPTSLRQQLIQAAIQGLLVPQNPNDEPASKLLERIAEERTAKLGKKAAKSMSRIVRRGSKTHSTYHEIFSDGTEKDISEEIPFDIPETWEWSRLGSFVDIKSGSTYKEVESGILYVKVGDMNLPENKIEIRSSTHFAECPDNAIIPAYSIIFPKRGGAISTNKKRTVKNFKICVDLNTMAISFPAQIFDFARVWFDNIELEKIANGSTIPQINNKDVEPLLFPLPPLVEQLRICNRLGKMLRTIDDTREQQ